MMRSKKSLKRLSTCFFLILSALSFGQGVVKENDTLLLWNKDRYLTWEDFKGKSNTPKNKYEVHQAAATATGPVFVHREDNKGNMIPYPLCYFYKSVSWSISEDSLLLAHEQLHFDIQEVYTRKLRMGFTELSEQNIYESSAYNNLSNKILKECANIQAKYDEEVSFNKVKQDEWRKCIDKELDELKEYEFVPEQ